MSNKLDATRRGACTSPQEQQDEEQHRQAGRPGGVVRRHIAGGGNQRHDLEGAVPESPLEGDEFAVFMVDGVDGDGHYHAQRHYQKQISPELIVLPYFSEPPFQCQVGDGIVHACKEHEQDDGVLKGGRIECHQAGIFGGKAARGHGGESVVDGIVKAHARQPEPAREDARQAHVNQPEALGCLLDSGMDFVGGGTGRFGSKQLDAADAEQWENGHREHDDTHAAYPLREAPPIQDALRYAFNVSEDGCAGGGHTGHGFEKSIGDVGYGPAHQVGQHPKAHHRQPAKSHDEVALPFADHVAFVGTQKPQNAPSQPTNHGRNEEVHFIASTEVEGERKPGQHQQSEDKEQDAQHPCYLAIVYHEKTWFEVV